jgi:hypothetical protein
VASRAIRTPVVFGFFLVVIFISAAGPVLAQSVTRRSELTVFAGASLGSPSTNDVDLSLPVPLDSIRGAIAPTIYPGPLTVSAELGGSPEFGMRYDWYLTEIVSIGGDFSIAPSHELSTKIRFGCPPGRPCIADEFPGLQLLDQSIGSNIVAYHYGGNVGIDLMRGTLRPTIIAGMGAVSYDGARAVSFDGTRNRDTEFAFRIGGAFKADAGPVVIRLEGIDVITPDHFVSGKAEHDLHVRVGVGVRW